MSSTKTSLQKIGVVTDLEKRSGPLLQSMADLFQQGQEPHHKAFPDHFGPADDRAAICQYLQSFLKPRNPLRKRYGFAKGWYAGGDIAGYLLYRLSKSSDVFYGESRWTCFIEDIVVAESARGMGGASALMTALMEEIEPLRNCAVSGNVWNMNAASEALFRKHGFEQLSKAFYKVQL